MEKLDELFAAYKPVTKEVLWENLKYFLEALMPTCKECDIKMAIHMMIRMGYFRTSASSDL